MKTTKKAKPAPARHDEAQLDRIERKVDDLVRLVTELLLNRQPSYGLRPPTWTETPAPAPAPAPDRSPLPSWTPVPDRPPSLNWPSITADGPYHAVPCGIVDDKPPKFFVEITKGWDGKAIDSGECTTREEAALWVKAHAPDFETHAAPAWSWSHLPENDTYTDRDVVDYGSHTWFGRVAEL